MKNDHDSSFVEDPVCGMLIDPSTAAATSTYHGQVSHFCSLDCKVRFDAVPESYETTAPACCSGS